MPVMLLFMKVPLRVAAATSNFMIGVTAATSAYVYWGRGDVRVDIAAPLVAGVFTGSLLGRANLIQNPPGLYPDVAGVHCRLAWRTDDLQVIDGRLPMNREDVAADRVLSLTLKFGAYTAFALIAAGLFLQLAVPGARKWLLSACLFCWLRRCLRIIVACLQFLREHDFKYALVSLVCWQLWCWHACWDYSRELYRDRTQRTRRTRVEGPAPS